MRRYRFLVILLSLAVAASSSSILGNLLGLGDNGGGTQGGIFQQPNGFGYPNFQGQQGVTGYPNQQGVGGFPNQQGLGGFPNQQGVAGYPNQQGVAGFPNQQGQQGVAGYPNQQGVAGFPNQQGQQGVAGYPNQQGVAGFPNQQGQQGVAGYPNQQGIAGFPNQQGQQVVGGYPNQQGVAGYPSNNPNFGGINQGGGNLANPNYNGAFPNNQFGTNGVAGNAGPSNAWGGFPSQGGVQNQPIIPANPPQGFPPQQTADKSANPDPDAIESVFGKPGEEKGPVVFETSTDGGIAVSEVPKECGQGADPNCAAAAAAASSVNPQYANGGNQVNGADPFGNGGSTVLNGRNQFVGNQGNNANPFNYGGLGSVLGFPQNIINGGYPASNGAPFVSNTGGLGTPIGTTPFANGGLANNAGAAGAQPIANGNGNAGVGNGGLGQSDTVQTPNAEPAATR